MTSQDFDIASFREADGESRAAASERLERHLQSVLRDKLESLFVEALGGLAEHRLGRELPWSEGEFAFFDPTEGTEGLRVAFDVVVSVGFGDRPANSGLGNSDLSDE